MLELEIYFGGIVEVFKGFFVKIEILIRRLKIGRVGLCFFFFCLGIIFLIYF